MLTHRFLLATALGAFILLTSAKCKGKEEPTPEPSSNSPIEICTGSSTSKNADYFNTNTTLTNHNTSGSGVDYIIGCGVTINSNITIEAGVKIWMQRDAYIIVGDGGQIKANGTPSERIVIEGENGSAEWAVLEFRKGGNVLEYVTIRNAGYSSEKSTIYVSSNPADLTMRNCTLSDGGGYGLRVEWSDSDLTFSNNTITNHKKAPLYITANQVNELDKASDLEGNTENFVQVYVGEVKNSVTWANLAIPYHVVSSIPQTRWITPADQVTLRIEAGTTIKFGEDTGLDSGKGILKIEGTSSAPITLQGINSGKGQWYGVYISSGLANSIDHAIIDGGGDYDGGGSYPSAANVMTQNGATLTIKNTELKNSSKCGLGDQPGATVNASNLTYLDNTGGNSCTRQ